MGPPENVEPEKLQSAAKDLRDACREGKLRAEFLREKVNEALALSKEHALRDSLAELLTVADTMDQIIAANEPMADRLSALLRFYGVQESSGSNPPETERDDIDTEF